MSDIPVKSDKSPNDKNQEKKDNVVITSDGANRGERSSSRYLPSLRDGVPLVNVMRKRREMFEEGINLNSPGDQLGEEQHRDQHEKILEAHDRVQIALPHLNDRFQNQSAKEGRRYVFVFGNDNFTRAGIAFMRNYHNSNIFRVQSLQQAEAIMADDIREQSNSEPIQIKEIVLLAHANKYGVLKIPITEKDSTKENLFAPWNLARVQDDMLEGKLEDFKRDRETVRKALAENSQLVVRGCFFGLSNDGLKALHSYMGGRTEVIAPTGVQGFELQPIGEGDRYIVNSVVEASESIERQGLVSESTVGKGKVNKIQALENILWRSKDSVPMQFFIEDEDRYETYKKLSRTEKLGKSGEYYKTRVGLIDPGIVFELSRLSFKELTALTEEYVKAYSDSQDLAYARDLQVLSEAWHKKDITGGEFNPNPNDPLGGLFPVNMSLVRGGYEPGSHLWRSATEAGAQTAAPGSDPFLSVKIGFTAPTDKEERKAAENEFDEELLNDAARPPRNDRFFSTHGFFERLPDGIRVWNFAHDKSEVKSEHTAAVKRLANQAKDRPDLKFLITGYASSSGTEQHNLELSTLRANNVADILVQTGVPVERILVVGQGEAEPIVSEESAERQARNRRVDIRIIGSKEQKEAIQAALNSTAEQSYVLYATIINSQQEVDHSLSEDLSKASLVVEIVSHVFEPVGLISPVLDWLSIVVGFSEAREEHRRPGLITGVELGIRAARSIVKHSSPKELENGLNAKSLEAMITHHDWPTNEWQEKLLDKNPLAKDAEKGAREGLQLVVQTFNHAKRAGEVEIRRSLEAKRLLPAEVEGILHSFHLAILDRMERDFRGLVLTDKKQ